MFLGDKINGELVIGIISPIGTDTKATIKHIKEHLAKFAYRTEVINIAQDVLVKLAPQQVKWQDEYERIKAQIALGNSVRAGKKDNSILMKGVLSKILAGRNEQAPQPKARTAYIIKSLKHPEEIAFLRAVYGVGFYLLGVTSTLENRLQYLEQQKKMSKASAQELLAQDANEDIGHGQHTQAAFQNADCFIVADDSEMELKNSIYRFLDLLFGAPFLTPTFDEYAMFMAYAASLRSADLSRQIGAVITKEEEIVASGVNDCPKFGGGLYWPLWSEEQRAYCDEEEGRDYKLGYDSNKIEQQKIIDAILRELGLEKNAELVTKIKNAGVGSLTEYGRVVHGEMEALLMCARNNISCKGAALYVTTFPCHNCAKHLIAAGIASVTYIEPYPKSKALELYPHEITEKAAESTTKVLFKPFVGIGPHRYIDLFSVSSSMWGVRMRKDEEGRAIKWQREYANLRTPMPTLSYIEAEKQAHKIFVEKVVNK
ncbi:MAG TPA: cytidine deaminase [Candidatus Avacidaminococcus intestinavium]|uniref:Cytidine deaminase n=1 Tax=Candidatus Avacidaminococcus intestinavium TaxID=2840684 RepID=A0A9D1MQI9_9FIRM|nr:cytidine deaminase [Candidatus Avacidaminococcus intestinavium]